MSRHSLFDSISPGYVLAAKVATALLAFSTVVNLLEGGAIPLNMLAATLGLYYVAYRDGVDRRWRR